MFSKHKQITAGYEISIQKYFSNFIWQSRFYSDNDAPATTCRLRCKDEPRRSRREKIVRPVTHFFSPFAFEFEIPWLAVIFWRAIFNQPK